MFFRQHTALPHDTEESRGKRFFLNWVLFSIDLLHHLLSCSHHIAKSSNTRDKMKSEAKSLGSISVCIRWNFALFDHNHDIIIGYAFLVSSWSLFLYFLWKVFSWSSFLAILICLQCLYSLRLGVSHDLYIRFYIYFCSRFFKEPKIMMFTMCKICAY